MPRNLKIAFFIMLGLVVAGGGAVAYWQFIAIPQERARVAATKALLYDTLGNAAGQQIIRTGMYRATFAKTAAANAGTNPAGESSSIAEIDVSRNEFRSVYAYRFVGTPKFNVGRCMGAKDYRDFRWEPERPTTLKEVSANLDKITAAAVELPHNPCRQLGIPGGGNSDVNTSRASDGFFPVTLTPSQAKNWTEQVKEADLFTVRDEGTVTKNGRTLRKLSFEPAPGISGTNRRLFDIFYKAGDIAQYRAMENPPLYQYSYSSIGVVSHGEISGYYLIDESKKLPVYSELKGSGDDNAKFDSERAAGSNVARTKQNYAFPQSLSLSLTSPLDFVQ